jgi:hypothetical protein
VYGISCLGSIDDGKIVDIEIMDLAFYPNDNSIKRVKIGFIADIPALGYRTYEVFKSDINSSKDPYIPVSTSTEKVPTAATKITKSHHTLFQNSEFTVEVDPETAVFTISKDGKQYVRGNEIYLEEEIGDLYYHRENLGLLKSELGEGIKYGSFKPENFQVVTGKIRTHITFNSKYFAFRWPYRLRDKLKPSIYRHDFIDIKKEIFIYKDSPRIDLITHIYDRHPHSRIRVKFDTGLQQRSSNPEGSTSLSNNYYYWSGTQFGAIKRPTNLCYHSSKNPDIIAKEEEWAERPTGIFPSSEWIDYSGGENENRGVSILHQGIPSHEVKDSSIYLTLLRSVEILSSDGIMGPCIPTPDATEMRPYIFRYSVLPHDGSWIDVASYRHGMELNMPLIALQMKASSDNIIQHSQDHLQGVSYGSDEEKGVQVKDQNTDIGREKHVLKPSSFSFLEIEPKNIVLSTLKLSDNSESGNNTSSNSNGIDIVSSNADNRYDDEMVEIRDNGTNKDTIIVRFYETEGKKETTARLRFGKRIRDVSITDLLENETRKTTNQFDIKIIDNQIIEMEVSPFKIVTLKVKF